MHQRWFAALLGVASLLVGQSNSDQTPIHIGAGAVLRGWIAQADIDLIVILTDSDGAVLAEFDSFERGPEPICFVANRDADYRVNVRAKKDGRLAYNSRLSLGTPHAASEEDRTFCRAVEESNFARAAQQHGGVDYLRIAADRYSSAVQLWKGLNEKSAELRTLNSLGTVQHARSQYESARETFSQALSLSRSLYDRYGEGEALNGLGMSSFRLGDVERAVDWLTETLSIWKELGFAYGESNALNNLGVLYYPIGDWQAALNSHLRALDLVRILKDRRGEAFTLNNLAVIYDAMGEPDTAMRDLAEALRLFREIGDRAPAGRTLSVMGRIAFAQNRAKAALAYENEALSIAKVEGDRRSEAEALSRIGDASEAIGDWQKAGVYYADALTQFQSMASRQGEALVLHRLGLLDARRGRTDSALELLNRALRIRSEIGLRDQISATLSDIARVERDANQLTAARSHIEAAIEQIETLRTRVPETTWRTSYFASKLDAYSFYIDLLMRLHHNEPAAGFDKLAFDASEKSRSRALLDMLGEIPGEIHRGAEPALIDRQRILKRQLNFQASQLLATSGSAPSQREITLRHDFDKTLTSLHEVEARTRIESSGYAELTQPSPLSMEEVQRTILDRDTLLLEYSLGPEASYLWVVGQTSERSFRLPPGAEIEASSARLLRAAARKTRDAEFDSAAAALSKMVLGPAARLLARKRLLVLSEGPLQQVPFSVLPAPGGTVPLIVDHEVVTSPSLSSLAVSRRERTNRRTPPMTALVFVDPVFDREDPRVPLNDRPAGSRVQAIPLARLPFSIDEARGVTSDLQMSRARVASGFEATKALITGSEASRYRILHIATHGLIDSRSPDLSGLMFSRIDSNGVDRDGFLRVPEIFDLNLPADLVVLSACRSGAGKEVRGEGIIGLTRAFMYAGAARVVVTQWNIDDEATAEFMKMFYQAQFGPLHMRPAAALRSAQVTMLKQPRWSAPYYWGAFVFHGEWR